MDAADVQELVIEGWVPTQIANGTARTMHWSKKRKIKEADAEHIGIAVRRAGWHPVLTGRPQLEITLVFPQRRKRDKDNLYARVKAMVDGIKRLGIIRDDDIDSLDLQIPPPIVERKRLATIVRLTSATPTDRSVGVAL